MGFPKRLHRKKGSLFEAKFNFWLRLIKIVCTDFHKLFAHTVLFGLVITVEKHDFNKEVE